MKLIDTNLLRVVNGDFPQASLACQLSCLNRLKEVMAGGGPLLLDSLGHILREYRQNAYPQLNPVGNAFLLWVLLH